MQVDDFLEKSTREERQGLAVEGIPDADLFFVDKVHSTAHDFLQYFPPCFNVHRHRISIFSFLCHIITLQAPDDGKATAEIKLPKKLQARQRMTRAQAILAGAHQAKPVATVPMKKIKKTSNNSTTKGIKPTTTASAKNTAVSKKTAETAIVPAKQAPGKKNNGDGKDGDLWVEGDALDKKVAIDREGYTGSLFIPAKKRRQVEPLPRAALAVEIDAPGCSFNPDRELHQDAVAEAVAAEMRKVYDRDLEPTAPVQNVDYDVDMDELDMLQVDAEDDDDELSGDESSEEEEAEDGRKKGNQMKKKTKKDRNKEVRRREEEAELAKRRREKKQRQELSDLKKIKAEVEGTLADREERLARRKADLAEKEAAEPPRLGKQKFEPMTVQVLTTEELEEASGSLRKLKPSAMLAKERFKSLQRRGIIEPRRKVTKRGKKKVEVIRGERADKAQERQSEVDELRSERKKLKSDNKKAKK